MAYRSRETGFDQLFNDLGKYVENTAEIIATSYAKEGTEAIAEAWADELIRFFTHGLIRPGLDDSTVANRRDYRDYVGKIDDPLYETGELLRSIEFIHTRIPSKNYDILEVGVFDDTVLIGHTDDITPHDLALIHEYGNENTPARPVFEYTALAMGHTTKRRIADAARKVKAAFDREKRTANPGTRVGRASIAAKGRFGGSGSAKVVRKGRIKGNTKTGYLLVWTDINE